MATANDILNKIKDEEIEWVDLRFTDPKGKWQHLTMVASVLGEDELEDGLMFDGSSIEGWKAINESDMILKPDLDSVFRIASMTKSFTAAGCPLAARPRPNSSRRPCGQVPAARAATGHHGAGSAHDERGIPDGRSVGGSA